MKRFQKRIVNLILTFLLLAGIASAVSTIAQAAPNEPEEMKVHFIDVGQGDSTLITCGGHSMLIDAGDDSKGTTIQNYLQKQKVEKLDYLVLTHPDADHIGGAPVIITKFDIDKVFVSNYEKDNKTYQKLIQALDNKRLKYSTPEVGTQYLLGTATVTVLAPDGEYDNPNDSSIALLIQNGDNTFLFTGDAGEDAENDILKNNKDISADVYKAGHHGSRYSTSQNFFKAVNPTYAVISCGEDNSYGHPHAETLNTLRTNGVKVYRTDEDGTIIATSDGKKISFNVPSSETWKAGEPAGAGKAANSAKTAAVSETEKAQAENEEPTAAVEGPPQEINESVTAELTYILNTKTKKFHKPACSSLPTVNRQDSSESRESIIAQGYEPCKRCNP
ncbi:MAG: MBL fold metallo-hydrolase [Blautia sp.]|nr:MBL fold metallo-hydrolase [Blautia sp.]MCM1202281.1 MBL fold metallo-hydrolase [Bacteroides fragilis]